MTEPTEAIASPSIAPRAPAPGATSPQSAHPHRFLPAANSLATGMALSACAGYLDGFTFVGHGHVFASAMTGNMVLLGIHIATDHDVLNYVLPLSAYVVGSILANAMLREGTRRFLGGRSHVITLLIEILVLGLLAFAPHDLSNDVLVPVLTVSTAMQNTAFRNIGTRTYNSVIMTGNLQAFANAFAAGLAPPTPAKLLEARDLAAVIASFIAGAALGADLTSLLGLKALLVPMAVLATGAVLLLASGETTH